MTTHLNTTSADHSRPTGHRIRHPRIAAAIDECGLLLEAGDGADLILLCGPTGAGKTTLGNFLVETELKNQAGDLAANPGCIPAIRVEAPASGEREFSWRLFFKRILDELECELDAPRTAYGIAPGTGRVVRPRGANLNTLAGLRTSVERSLKSRGARFIVVDEAAHIPRQCHHHLLERQFDTLKSLSNECGVQWILMGSYDLFELISLSGQLARRSHIIHFSRYREDVADDLSAFHGCIKYFGQSLPALKQVDLLKYAEVFHQNTLGCIGILRDVLVRLDLLVSRQGWSEDTLRRALLTEAQVTQILREIVEGEERIAPGLKRNLIAPQTNTGRRIA